MRHQQKTRAAEENEIPRDNESLTKMNQTRGREKTASREKRGRCDRTRMKSYDYDLQFEWQQEMFYFKVCSVSL